MAAYTSIPNWLSDITQKQTDDSVSIESTADLSSSHDQVEAGDHRYRYITIGYLPATGRPLAMERGVATQVRSRRVDYFKGDDNPYRLPRIAGGPESLLGHRSEVAGNRETKPKVVEYAQRGDGYGDMDRPILLRSEIDPYRLPGIAARAESIVVDNKNPIRRVRPPVSRLLRSDGYHREIVASEPPNDSVAICYMDADTLARLEGRDCFEAAPDADIDWTQVSVEDAVLGARVSKFSDDSIVPISKPARVFRSLSKKVKSVMQRPSIARRSEVSQPTNFQDLHPECGSDHILHPDVKAIPIKAAQARFLRPQTPVGTLNREASWIKNTPENGSRYPFALKPRSSRRRRPVQVEQASMAVQPVPQTQRTIKFVGEPDRMTEFGDFMDLSDSDTLVPDEIVYDGDFNILETKPLRLSNKPHSTRATKSPLPQPAKVTSMNDWRMSEEYPTVQDLFDQIDEQIAESDIAEHEKPAANREAHRLNGMFDRARLMDKEGEMPEPLVDTYVRKGHASWYVTNWPDESTVQSEYRRVKRVADGQ